MSSQPSETDRQKQIIYWGEISALKGVELPCKRLSNTLQQGEEIPFKGKERSSRTKSGRTTLVHLTFGHGYIAESTNAQQCNKMLIQH